MNRLFNLIRWLALAAVVAGGFWLGARQLQKAKTAPGPEGGSENFGPPPTAVMVADVQKLETRETIRVTGTLRAAHRSDIAARETGPLTSIRVNEGDAVAEMDVLATIDDRRLKAEIAELQANLTAAKALVTQREAESTRAASDLKMKQQLVRDRALSRRELLDAEREVAVADAREQAARGPTGSGGKPDHPL